MRAPLALLVLCLSVPARAGDPAAFDVPLGDFLKKPAADSSMPTVVGKPAGGLKAPPPEEHHAFDFFFGKRKKKPEPAAKQQPKEQPLVIVTGFEAFQGAKGNSSDEVAKELDGKTVNGSRVESKTLPVAYDEAGKQVKELLAKKPAILIMFGMSEKSKPQVETQAKNANETRDETGGCGADEDFVDKDGPDTYKAGKSVDGFLKELKADGLRFRVSKDAGGFVCNATYYKALKAAEEAGGETMVVFIHLPTADEHLTKTQRRFIPSMPLRRIQRWSRRAVESAVDSLDEDAR